MHREADTRTTHFYAAPFCLLCTLRRSSCDESKLLVSFWKCFLSGEKKSQEDAQEDCSAHITKVASEWSLTSHGSKVGTKIFPEKHGFF